MQDRFKYRVKFETDGQVEIFDVTKLDMELGQVFFKREDGQYYNIGIGCKDVELMQCTGLKDKNGKLIYEGDIVKFAEYDWTDFSFKGWEQQKAVVIWGGDYDYPAFDLKGTDFDGTNGLSYIFGEGWTIEVIGNVYESEELLNGTNP